MVKKIWTILDLINWTTDYFKKKGIPSPRRDAEVLLAHQLTTDRVGLYLKYDQPLNKDELASFRNLVKRRAKREPIQYIIGKKEFFSVDFEVNPSVLIPRPETEILVEEILKELKKREEKFINILEIGTGSGAVSIILKKEIPFLNIFATDISFDALKIAKENANRIVKREKIQFIGADKFSPFKEKKGGIFDFIVSNPPYIPEGQIQNLQEEIRLFEPISALDGGKDGLDFIKVLIEKSPFFLRNNGMLFIEIGEGQAEKVLDFIKSTGSFESVKVKEDLSGIKRVVAARRKRWKS
ncbi:MAG: peptide chain release factor N(5)-glutamine methyltransferase [Deltaproteobacteria bacterium]|nr:peptide chain release factor N(5)-glutamine methyltransferase [Deltaproteobacteria bacterium]